uniref:NB-ARC domain-containing protein n=1 Tax=Lactuca sativa TaxID=4236 RepID=A0A9R1WCQ3_LACSA|nr:hypothetical protein LSAT_V11C200051130 [Lactuca sativa]
MEVAIEIVRGVVQVLMVPVKKQLDYLISYKKYVKDMHAKLKDLDAARVGVESQKKQNRERRLEVPAQVDPWLIEVEKMNEKVEDFPSEVLGCLDLKSRHKLGRKSFKIFKEIESVLGRCPAIQGTELQIPVGRIDSTIACTSTPSSDRNDFRSREKTFTETLESLGPNHSSHMVALCGMGGVGKTTMMRKLKEVVIAKKMFNHYVEAVIGEKTDPIAIQQAVAEYLGINLTETTKPARTEQLCKWFTNNSDGGKKKFLVILDDVWQSVDMEDIGLSRLPNQGVDFKVLITSRDKAVCTEMGVKADSVIKMSVLEEAEAQSLFCQLWEPSDDVDPELHKIGEEIVKKCCGLPIAIKTMACTLRSKSKDTWKNALSRLQHHDINTVAPAVFKTSYDNLQDEVTGATFLLCGLFPEDFNIPSENLLRYGWGLKLFKGLDTIREARYQLNACIERLIHTNLLIECDVVGCVKMHDLVRSFVLDMFSNSIKHASIINHGSSKPGWPETENDMSASCKRISLTCKGMIEFPSDLNFPNLSILKLMHGDKLLRFPRNFYEKMVNLQVISFDHMMYPMLSSSLECCTNLRMLCVHECSLAFDFYSIGNLLNLEVLSFAKSGIKSLPSTIRNLKKLRILDVTGCDGLCIDNSIFKKLVKIEELYACRFDHYRGTISFTGDNCNEVIERWKNISALEFDFCENNSQWKNLSFENLEQFKISVGGCLKGEDDFIKRKLIQKHVDVVNQERLFEKTEVLCLSVEDMNDLEDVGVKSSLRPQSSSFHNLRILIVSECAELKYLFTLSVAKVLSNLEHLEVFDCLVMKELIHTEDRGEETITFPKLKVLSLSELLELLGLCQNVNIIALPQIVKLRIGGIPNITSIFSKNKPATSCLLKEEVFIPQLEHLCIWGMENLKEIWPCDFRSGEEVKLSKIEVMDCENLVNIFPCNPSPLLRHLEELQVRDCGSIEVLFNIDMDCVGETGEGGSSSLRRIEIVGLGQLREVCRIKGANHPCLPIRAFQALESIIVRDLEMCSHLPPPILILGHLRTYMNIYGSGEIERKYGLVESSQGRENTLFPTCLLHSFHHLRKLELEKYQGVEVIFEIKSTPTSQDNQQRIFPYLENLNISSLERVSRVWKFNWNELLILHRKLSESPFHNLTTIQIEDCKSIKYLFSPLMAKLLSNLKKVKIHKCYGMEEVVSNRDDDEEEKKLTSTSTHTTSTTLFPLLDSLILYGLHNLKCIGGGGGAKAGNNEISFNSTTTTTYFLGQDKFSQGNGVSWSLCQYSREITIYDCHALSSVIPWYAAGQMQNLEMLKIEYCHGMKEMFETQGINKSFIRMKPKDIENRWFLVQLEELNIEKCKALKVIVVKEENDGEQTTKASSSKVVVFPRLKSIVLFKLPEVVGFFLGTNHEFQWPSLDDLVIKDCPQMKVFTAGKHLRGHWFNSHVTTTTIGQRHKESRSNKKEIFGRKSTSFSFSAATSEEINIWSFHNLIELHMEFDRSIEKIIPANELVRLQKLEKIQVKECNLVEEVFEVLEGTSSGFDESQITLVKLPNLTQVKLVGLHCLSHIWKSNPSTVFEFPNLTRVSIEICYSLEHVFSSAMVGSLKQLKELQIINCDNMEVVFVQDGNFVVEEEEESDGKMNEIVLPRRPKSLELYARNRWTLFEFPNLTRVCIERCGRLEYVFSSSMTGSLKQLQELSISKCHKMEEVIVKDTDTVVEEEEESDGKTNDIVFPRLKSLKLSKLRCLKGFFLGKEDFSFPLLDTLTIQKCPKITTFTTGNSAAPDLKGIETGFGWFYVEEDINSFIKMKQQWVCSQRAGSNILSLRFSSSFLCININGALRSYEYCHHHRNC